jgi:hypothetical protein
LSTRLAAAEAELQSIEEVLADVLDILAAVKASQDEMRENHDARDGRAERHGTEKQRPSSWRLSKGLSILGRARLPMDPVIPEGDQVQKDELAFWKTMGRIAVAGLFLMTIFMIGLYQLMNSRLN